MDIFGLPVTLRIEQEKNHQTKMGGFFTIIISSIIIYQLSYLIKSVFDQDQPNVIQQQNYVYQPELFSIHPKTFSFAFGVQDSLSHHFIDETIYKIKAVQQINTRVLNPNTGNYELKTEFRDVKVEICTKDHFQIDEIKYYFLKLPLHQIYCISLQEDSISIEGEFSAIIFKQFNIQVHECTGSDCADTSTRRKKLTTARLAIYTSENIIQMTDKDKPYQLIGKNLFWIQSLLFESEIRYQIINNYVYTDVGIISSNMRKDRIVSYSSDRVQMYDRSTSRIFNFYINYEKNKEQVFYRKYMKFDQAFSQIGGTFNILVAIGCFLCRPISQLELNRKLLNKVFNIETSKSDQKNYQQEKQINPDIQQQHLIPSKLSKIKGFFKQSQQKQRLSNYNESVSIQKKQPDDINVNKGGTLENNQNQELDKNKNNKLKFKLTEYFLSFFSLFNSNNHQKSQLIKYGTDIIYSHIDIFNIINKLLEIEKIKHLLLNENQLKLFEYLPKPTLQSSDVKQELKKISNKKLSFSTSFRSKSIFQENFSDQYKQNTDFIIVAQKSQKEKKEDALKAYEIITSINRKSKIDLKLIEMLDGNLINQFQQIQNKQNSHLGTQINQQSNSYTNMIQIQNDRDYSLKQKTEFNSPKQFYRKNNNKDFKLFSLNELLAKQCDLSADQHFSHQIQSNNEYQAAKSVQNSNDYQQKPPIQLNEEDNIEQSIQLPNLTTNYNFQSNRCQLNQDFKQL